MFLTSSALLLLVVLFLQDGSAAHANANSTTKNRTMSPCKTGVASELAESGKALRRDLQVAYDQLRSQKTLTVSLSGNDINYVLAKYIHSGMSFDSAQAILRSAGFDLQVPDAHSISGNSNQTANRVSVVGVIKVFAESLLGHTSVYVFLVPPAPGEYTSVESVSAVFMNSSL
jgi:hypothetical protein